MPANTTIKIRKGTESEWQSSNPILASGEPGYAIDTNRFKIGDGSSNWNSLSYASVVPSGFLAGSGININLGTNGSNATISVSGLNSSYISDFNSSVSGLLPVKDIVPGIGVAISSATGVYTINVTGSGVISDQAASLVTTVFNHTGSIIPKMTAVYINGGQGDMPTVGLAIATGDATSAGTYGLTYSAINNMETGQVIVFGALTGLNTDPAHGGIAGATEGSVVYLSPSVSGGLTTTKPYAPNHIVTIGTVVRVHQNEGVIEVRINNGFELEELHNVATTGATNGQFLQYNSATGLWVPSSSGNFTSLTINNSGVPVGSGTTNYVSRWTGSSILGTGILFDNGSSVIVGNTSSSFKFDITSGANNNIMQATTEGYTGFDLKRSTNGYSELLMKDIGGRYLACVTHPNDLSNTIGYVAGIAQGIGNGVTLSTAFDSDGRSIALRARGDIVAFASLGGSATERLRITSSGNVGIGTSSPSYRLDVNGSGNFASGLAIANQTASTIASFDTNKNVVSLSTGTYPSLTELSYVKGATSEIQTQLNAKQNTLTNPVTGTGVANHIVYWNSTSGIVADSGQLYWDSTNNRLGIGTTSPASDLQVVGTGRFTNIDINNSAIAGTSALTVNGSISTQSQGVIAGQFSVYGDQNTRLYKPDSTTFAMSSANSGIKQSFGYLVSSTHTPWMTITNSGVGIGTTTPSGQLHVIGTGNFSQNLLVNGTGVSISGHTHIVNDITDFSTGVADEVSTTLSAGTGILLDYNSGTDTLTVSISGLINNPTNNRVLTSRDNTTTGIDAEANLTFDGTNLTSPYLVSSNASGDEGGEIQLAKPPNGTLSGGVTIDAYQNKLRFFEQGGSARGFYLDLAEGLGGASTPLRQKSWCYFTPLDNQPPASNFATLDTRNSIAVLDFDHVTEESAVFVGVVPDNAIVSSGISVRILWMATSETTGNCRWGVQFDKLAAEDTDTAVFDTATEATTATSATNGTPVITTLTCTTVDALVAGDFFRIKIYRDASDTTNDTLAADAELIAVEVRGVI